MIPVTVMALLAAEIFRRYPYAVLIPSLGNLAIRETAADDALFVGIINFATGDIEWRFEK